MRVLGCLAAAVLLLGACDSSARPSPSRAGIASVAPAGASTASSAPAPGGSAARDANPAVPHFAHIVVVVEENHADDQIMGNPLAPYMNSLARTGVQLTQAYGIRHPSQPNYVALFSGSTHGLTDDSCPHTFGGPNLGSQLIAHGQRFAGYSQSLPAPGFAGCSFFGNYARKHAPWVDFSNLPASVNRPWSAFPRNYNALPDVAFVIPDLDHDMHDGTIAQADSWLRENLAGYVSWARTHDSLFVLTWDEDDNTPGNHIPALLAGAHLRSGRYNGPVDHYRMLRTIEAACGLAPLGQAAQRSPITGIWTP
jgi:acid phosphatase